jgi:hypothetical protein
VGCGLLTKIGGHGLLSAEMEALADSEATGTVSVYPIGTGVCFFGFSENLEPSLSSVLVDGPDCSAANGCGGHIHTGISCENATTQGGHFYNVDTVAEDPWKLAGYLSTDAAGMGYFMDCLETGESAFADHAFIVHASDGSRVSCGTLPGGSHSTSTDPDSAMMMNTLQLTTAVTMVMALAAGL